MSQELTEADEQFRQDHLEILERFYSLFDSIYRYIQVPHIQTMAWCAFVVDSVSTCSAQDFLAFISDLKEGIFIQHTIESVLFDTEGKQLMAEAVYLYGVALTLMDCKIDGLVRERMLVAYFRARGQNEDTNIDEVCKLCARTGFSVDARKVT